MNKMNRTEAVLVTGGAGYIGSHAALALREAGYRLVVLDNLSTGVRSLVPDGVPFVEGDVADAGLVHDLIEDYAVGAVIHFAGSIVVPESIEKPLDYYRNNTAASRTLIESCVRSGVGRFVFSSTAAVYGEPHQIPIAELAATEPASPYGRSKLMTEWMLADTSHAHDFRYAALRYFNVAGADPHGRCGQSTPRATHLIKVASELVVGQRPCIEVFGSDYPTPDGTCVRDYIHVSDLADAHVAAVRHLETGGASVTLNCGYGHGFSVREVLNTVERVCGRRLDIREAARRPGDPAALVADPAALKARFGWRPRFDDLDVIVRSAIAWEERLAGQSVPA